MILIPQLTKKVKSSFMLLIYISKKLHKKFNQELN